MNERIKKKPVKLSLDIGGFKDIIRPVPHVLNFFGKEFLLILI
jgi:hypothetical protein